MNKWEHPTFTASYDKKRKDWVIEYDDHPALVGLQAILEAYGAEGWELVNMAPDHSQAYPGWGAWHIEPDTYRATFKRLVGDRS